MARTMRVNWKKTAIVMLDMALATYLIAAFLLFNKPDVQAQRCEKVRIDIQDETTNGFITVADIKARLDQKQLYPLDKPMASVPGREIEEMLVKSPFVKTVECYKTQNGSVNIAITQRMPVVRIKAANGDDYYLDDNNRVMPNSHYSSDLIIATGNISKAYARNYVSTLSNVLMNSDLWKNQIEQINVLPDKGIELVPRVGEHIIYIGHLPETSDKKERRKRVTDYVEKKMTRLEKFYKYGLSQVGWNKYSYINIEFDNQIICKKRTANHHSD